MNRLIMLFACVFLFACNGRDSSYPKAEDSLDAAREFIDAFLDGDTRKASAYMVNDEENRNLLRKLHRQLESHSEEDRQGYKESSIIIGSIENVTEDIVIIQYRSSYDREPRKVKVVRQNGTWLVDLKYTVNPNL
ncbi:MAG TPA: hypothetical protein VF145_01435 [Chitinophagaceae bacterium]